MSDFDIKYIGCRSSHSTYRTCVAQFSWKGMVCSEIRITAFTFRYIFWDSIRRYTISVFQFLDYILITSLMHWLLFIHKILFSSTCFEPQVLIFRRIQLYTCSLWYCHSLWEFLVACRYTASVRTGCRGKVVGGCLKTPTNNLPPTVSSHSSCVPTGHQELS